MENNTITPQFSLKTLLYKLPPKLDSPIANTILCGFAAGLIITPLLQNLLPCHLPPLATPLPSPTAGYCFGAVAF